MRQAVDMLLSLVVFLGELAVSFGQFVMRQVRQYGPGAARATGRGLVATLRWSGNQLLRALRNLAREIVRWASRTAFGNWRRTVVTLVVISLLLMKCYPQQAGPIVGPLLQIGLVLVGIRIMLIPIWPMGRRERRRR
jgi:hypothetical protein